MKSRNPAFENSLACLQHPLTLLSIAVLLLNDHVLKIVAPSWLTGKISDFAGLFFFPFIVAAGLSLIFSKLNLTRQRIGQITFGLVAIWFTLLKTVPFVNLLTADIASLFIGAPARLILDPTDLMALIILYPAWMIWNQPRSIKLTKFAYLALSIGAFAVMATSPREATVYSVTDLNVTKDGIVYATDKENYGERPPIAISKDGGQTWELSFEEKDAKNIDQKTYPISLCYRVDFSRNCYRIKSNRQFEITSDDDSGEKNWFLVFDSNDLVVKATDMAIVSWEGKDYLLVAIGEGGILRRELLHGGWEIIEVLGAKNR
ncbi:MAG: hypothetical protein HY867_08360 [Chloroflexi bacterium]|nr:hypothetical protein [Chloroflexota bacterium]